MTTNDGDLRKRIEALEDGKRRFLHELGRLPPQVRSWRPAVDSWSALEVAHHLALIEIQVLRAMSEGDRGETRATDRLGRVGLWAVFRLGLKVPVPTKAVRPDPTLPLGEVERIWQDGRDALLGFVQAMNPDELRTPGARHPLAGPMSPLGWLGFLADHQNHHFRQLDRIRSRPNFPWNV